ncbi:MAG: 30S ribosome-binding factor RbfA [Defluviitaleaceae bacterium]|nr:30S ribosome-binding factor RbfA [Defluviitaleaceae bacterium]MCL2240571.1 30S ribosome-binding factor RbfA [Defluviitaleaceae bacterium]
MKTRQIRINDAVARTAASVIRSELADPRIGTVVSVIRAEVTADLKFCKIWVSILGDEAKQEETMAALGKASGFIRRRVAEEVNLRHTPEITFVYDDSIAHGMRMRKLIDEANK